MTGHAVWALIVLLALACEYVWLHPAARTRLHRVLLVPLVWRAWCARRTLAALARAALLRPYRGHHTPRRTQP